MLIRRVDKCVRHHSCTCTNTHGVLKSRQKNVAPQSRGRGREEAELRGLSHKKKKEGAPKEQKTLFRKRETTKKKKGRLELKRRKSKGKRLTHTTYPVLLKNGNSKKKSASWPLIKKKSTFFFFLLTLSPLSSHPQHEAPISHTFSILEKKKY